MKVLIVSSVVPKPSMGGSLILHRHFVECESISVLSAYSASALPEKLKFLQRLRKTRFHTILNLWELLWSARHWDRPVSEIIHRSKPDCIVTVAHQVGCFAAQRIAQKHSLPLVTFFHDWWPDILTVPAQYRSNVGKKFLDLYRYSALALCVSKEMQQALGEHDNAIVLYPIPARSTDKSWQPAEHVQVELADGPSNKFQVSYFGNLYNYGAMIRPLLEASLKSACLSFKVGGSNPQWPKSFQSDMAEKGLFVGFLDREELLAILQKSDLFLVPMSFDPKMRRRMATSFPSKLVEYLQFGKPVIVWGPDYASAVQWAKRYKAAITVTSSDPNDLVKSLENISKDPEKYKFYAQQAQTMAQSMFSPDQMQQQFMTAIQAILASQETFEGSV